MYGLMTLAVILFFTVLGPLIVIFYFITKWKQTREISSDWRSASRRWSESSTTMQRHTGDNR